MKFNRYKKIPEIKSFLTLKINWLSTKTNVYDLIENKNMFRIQENDERVRVLDLDGLIVEPEILRIDRKFEINQFPSRVRTLTLEGPAIMQATTLNQINELYGQLKTLDPAKAEAFLATKDQIYADGKSKARAKIGF